MQKILIIGGVAAGATAAAKARRISQDAQITVLEAGPDISFANCGLPYYIGRDIESRSKLILQSPESFKQQYNVDVFVNTRAVSIDRKAKIVSTLNSTNGEEKIFEYDKLILAQGGRPIQPNLPGADLPHVFSLWTLEDMDKIDNFFKENNPKTAVVVGGGFIGLEMVEALAKRGLKVNVVEMMPHVMSVMDAEIAGFIEDEMMAYGVGIHTSAGVTDIFSKSVRLDNGKELNADMVLLSIGVRPTLQLAQDAGLEIGEAGGLLVDEYLQTSDPDIYGAGDMAEIVQRVHGKKVRIPLAGPANRQGRIAAENVLGGKHAYKGSIGTSIVRVFEAVAGITGLSLKQARNLEIDADAVVVHKEHHTTYYPGAETVTVKLVYDKSNGVILGGQTCGYKGADRRLDVIAMAVANKLTVDDLSDVDFAYSPPLGTPNDGLNMAAYTAENKRSGFSPSITAAELDEFVQQENPVLVDIRDIFAYEKSHIEGSKHLPLEIIREEVHTLPKDRPILVCCINGKTAHQALRTLKASGFDDIMNISGGYTSLQRYERAVGFENIKLELPPIEYKSLEDDIDTDKVMEEKVITQPIDDTLPIIVDVRTKEEFIGGAHPEAVNIPLDELMENCEQRLGKNRDRDIVFYCASGARSAYAMQLLRQMGYTNVKNGGGLMQMMMRR